MQLGSSLLWFILICSYAETALVHAAAAVQAQDLPISEAADGQAAAATAGGEQSALSPEAVRRAVDALEQNDVAWRKVAWKTCLLAGLQASREQDKPIILWIFIDRPIDDERC